MTLKKLLLLGTSVTFFSCSDVETPSSKPNTNTNSPPACGNGALDTGELCDPLIAAGTVGACPADCADTDVCTADSRNGDSAACTAVCAHAPISQCIDADGCCPAGCNALTDDEGLPIEGLYAVSLTLWTE